MVKQIRSAVGVFLRGFAMGCADLVPGVSGGTIALITHIYERVIGAITSIDIHALRLFFQGRMREFWQHIDGSFLLLLFIGILTAIFTLANSIAWLLDNQPLLIWSFFSGLILASAVFLLSQLEVNKALPQLGFTILGMLVVISLGYLRAELAAPSLLIVFGAGFIAISAMLLPGISGSFILLMLGLYEPTLEAVRGLNLFYLVSFAAGAICGFLVFSRIIEWTLKRYHHQTLMFLVGLLLGSLNATWPWKLTPETAQVSRNLMPSDYAELFGSAELGMVLLVFLAAILLVWVIEFLGRGRSHSSDAR